jgi:transposase
MWKPEHRVAADRSGLRYPSDLTDAEWVLVEPLIPPARRGGRRRSVMARAFLRFSEQGRGDPFLLASPNAYNSKTSAERRSAGRSA